MPNYYAQLNKAGKVIGISQLSGEVDSEGLIPISVEQYESENLLMSRYVNGAFIGQKAVLEADKSVIIADGSDMVILRASVIDISNVSQDSAKAEVIQDITFELNGVQQTVPLIDGYAEISISSEEPGEYVIRTVNLDYNAELLVVAADVS